MNLKSAQEDHINWIKTQLEQTQRELTEAEANLVEVKALVEQKRANVAYYQNKLEAELSSNDIAAENDDIAAENDDIAAEISSAFRELEVNANHLSEQAPTVNSSGNVGQVTFVDEELEEESFEENQRENQDDEEGNKRNPRDMLYPEFRGKTFGEAVEIILDKFAAPVNRKQIASRLFDAKSEHEQLRATNSLANQLHQGVKEGRWKKVGRGLFASNSFQEQVTDEINN
ncbi:MULTISPECIES: hypothetical protein [unclassified Moorena]|uniref:hypothetical protein n=1 Tax=unclassified Moorena TaxID=2683338 RepID=UPI0013C99637|nr:MULTISPECIES: hypothetical protein [unclassified Moorena]NEO18724.1 hypothetical protein [Moorena sp. SIO4A5]NEQ58066.1 hypothetical protein [Moorena sp. SIO4A1]